MIAVILLRAGYFVFVGCWLERLSLFFVLGFLLFGIAYYLGNEVRVLARREFLVVFSLVVVPLLFVFSVF